jgi:dipeptidyl aminopeptidase/acylaminoacyl peptidase
MRPAALALLVFAPLAAGAAEPKLPLTAERSWEIQRLGPPTISPDGRHAVAGVTRFEMKDNKGFADLWLWRTDGSETRRLTSHPASESSPQFSPDGKRIVFIAQRDEDEAPQLYLLALDGGEATRLTSVPTGVAQPKWFPDGRRIAFLSRVWPELSSFEEQGKRLKEREDNPVKAQAWDSAPVYFWDTFIDDRQLHVFAVSIEGGEPQPLTVGSGFELPRTAVQLEVPLYDIAPDGKELAFVADSDPRANHTNGDIFVLELGTSTARNLTQANTAPDGAPQYSPDGKYLAFARQLIDGFYGDKRRLMLTERATGAIRQASPESWDRSADGLVWAADSKRLYGAIDDAGTTRVYELPLDRAPRAITGESSFGALAISEQGRTVLVGLRQSFTEPPTLVRIDVRDGAATKLSTANDALLAATHFGTFESVTYAGADGVPIQMWVNYPPGFDRSRKYPLFLLIHGGPHNAMTNGMQFRWNAQVFGTWGYVTGWPNFHGSSGFGNAFSDSINPQQDDLPYRDVIAAANWFAQQPWIDAERMAAGGGSYGGYLTTIILGREHPFKTLIAHAAVYNWYTQVGADYAFEYPRFGGFWSEDQQRVFRNASPHYGAANFDTPTLVIHGQRDFRVPVNHGIELYQALVQRGVDTRLIYFPDENHWVLKPQNSRYWYGEVERWLARHLDVAPSAASAGGD